MRDLPKRVVAAITAAGLLGVMTVVVTAAVTGHEGVGSLLELIPFVGLLTLTWTFPMLVLRRDETEAFSLDEAFLVAMVLLLPPLGAVVAFAIATTASQFLRRRPLARIVFNAGQTVASAGAALVVFRWLADSGTSVSPRDLLAAVVAAAAFFVVNTTAVSAVLALAEGERFTSVCLDGIGFRSVVCSGAVCIGLLAAVAGSAYSWALLLAAVPMGVLQAVLAVSLRARRDRQRVDGLFRAALDAHASMKVEDVEAALVAAAADLLRARGAKVSTEADGDLRCRLAGSDGVDRWLTVSEPRGVAGFEPRDAALLEALAAVGSGALENARLVDQIKHQAFHDVLTGLPNHVLLEERLTFALGQARRRGEHVAVLFVDLDRFKKVNDGRGHAAGNELLRQVAVRLAAQVRDGDTVARLGGDEFTVLLTGIRSPADVRRVSEKVLASFRTPFLVDGSTLFITPSIGVAVSPDDGESSDALLKNASAAMYCAKERGRNTFQLYTAGMTVPGDDRLRLEADLYAALENDGLSLVYQPQIELETGRVVGVEALVRWMHPVRGLLAPDSFVPLAEETGLIVPLDTWVLRTACAQARAWMDAGLPPLRIAVNLSGRGLERAGLVDIVRETLDRTGVRADQLELEITETVAVSESAATVAALEQLRSLGVHLSIDDFGTGYSVLNRLRNLPFDRLKIDRSFVWEIDDDAAGGSPIVAALIAMAHGLGLEVVAEGVETPAQRAFLERQGCDQVQGYLTGRPATADVIAAVVEAQSPLAAPALTLLRA